MIKVIIANLAAMPSLHDRCLSRCQPSMSRSSRDRCQPFCRGRPAYWICLPSVNASPTRLGESALANPATTLRPPHHDRVKYRGVKPSRTVTLPALALSQLIPLSHTELGGVVVVMITVTLERTTTSA
jgi:hypothetical protein